MAHRYQSLAGHSRPHPGRTGYRGILLAACFLALVCVGASFGLSSASGASDAAAPPPASGLVQALTSTPIPTASPLEALGMNAIRIGYSVEGRPLEVYQFGTGASARMIVAGIHGSSEWNTIALAEELIVFLADHRQFVPGTTTLYILRSLNPDGEAQPRGATGRPNAHGVDLNRNWPINWRPQWPRQGCWNILPTTGGPYPTSEPETEALLDFLTYNPVEALISYHSAALGIFPGGSPPDPDSEDLAETLAAVSPYPYPPIDTGCLYTGMLADYASAAGIAAVDLELRTHWDTDFEQNLEVLEAFLAWEP